MVKDDVFGDNPLPVGTTARKTAAQRYCDAHNIECDKKEIEADVGEWERRQGTPADRLDALGQELEDVEDEL